MCSLSWLSLFRYDTLPPPPLNTYQPLYATVFNKIVSFTNLCCAPIAVKEKEHTGCTKIPVENITTHNSFNLKATTLRLTGLERGWY
jgi:hypothetical protein